MGASVVSMNICHLVLRGVLSDLVAVVRALGLWLLSLFILPSEMLWILEALLWLVVALSSAAVVVLVFPTSGVAQ